jgi:hypothetical protein
MKTTGYLVAAMAAGAALAMAQPAAAQAWIGTVVGNYAAAQKEQACQTTRRPSQPEWDEAAGKIDAVMAMLARPDQGGDARDLPKVFASTRKKDFRLVASEGPLTLEQARQLLRPVEAGGAAKAVSLKVLAVAGDNLSARAIWTVVLPSTEAGGDDRFREVGVDYTRDWGRWKILHLQAFPVGEHASEPGPYCHFNETGRF